MATYRLRPLGLALLVVIASSAVAQEIPGRPEKLTFAPFAYTPPAAKDHRTVLKSGPVVYIAEDHELPLVNVVVTLRGGTYLDPAGKEGLAELAGYLLVRGGTKSMSAEDLEEELAFLAANLNSSFGADRGTVSLNLMKKDLDRGLALLREVLTAPRFQEDKLALRKEQLLADMKKRNDDSADIESRERGFLETGERFYLNRHVTKASLDSITKEDLAAFHAKWFSPKNVSIAVAGDFDRASMLKKLDGLFAAWPLASAQAAPPVPKPDFSTPHGVFLVDKDVNQGRVTLVLPGILRTEPDSFAANVMVDILGAGGFTSRITNRVRSDEGLAYDARAGLRGGVWYRGNLEAGFQSKVRTCAYATDIVLDELKKMKTFGEPKEKKDADAEIEELKTSKNSFIETLPRRFQTKAQAMGILLDEEFTGRYQTDPGYYASYRARFEKVTKEDVNRAAKRLLVPEQAALLVVGKKADLLNPDPKHPKGFGELGLGEVKELPLRDPLTMKPLPLGAAK